MNTVCLMGRLTKDPELRYTNGNNTAVGSFTLAVDRDYKVEGQPEADFIPVVTWTKTAEFANRYFSKGQRISLVGRIQTRTWDDDQGVRHYVTEVVADKVYFASDKKGEGQPPAQAQQQPTQAQPQGNQQQSGGYQQPSNPPPVSTSPAQTGKKPWER